VKNGTAALRCPGSMTQAPSSERVDHFHPFHAPPMLQILGVKPRWTAAPHARPPLTQGPSLPLFFSDRHPCAQSGRPDLMGCKVEMLSWHDLRVGWPLLGTSMRSPLDIKGRGAERALYSAPRRRGCNGGPNPACLALGEHSTAPPSHPSSSQPVRTLPAGNPLRKSPCVGTRPT